MSVLPKLFKRVKQRVPQARLQWAYGWNLFELCHRNNPEGMRWMAQIRSEMDDAGIETLGHLSLAEVGRLYQRGTLLAYLLINTSSPDRSMSVLPRLFKEVKRQVPRVRLQWSYGWDLFELYSTAAPDARRWMQQTKREMAAAGIETLGHLSPEDVGKLYQRAAIFAYPSDFPENDCISVKKAQACGCVPVTSDAGALATSVQFGVKLRCKQSGERSYHGIEDEATQRLWIDATVDLLEHPEKRANLGIEGAKWARQFDWAQIATRWDEILRG